MILIVDDEPLNIKLIKTMLLSEGYEIHDAASGEEALESVRRLPPDLILLDVMMPGINGFEVCRQLKNNDQTKAIPIIMVTALQKQDHGMQAMETGADDDFLSKPIDRSDLLIRVKSLLRIKRYHDELLDSYTQIALKNKELEELEKMKEGLIHMIIHDLRTPLAAILSLLDLTLLERDRFSEEQAGNLEKSLIHCTEMNDQIKDLLNIQQMENTELTVNRRPTDISSLIHRALIQVRGKADSKSISLTFAVPDEMTHIDMDDSLIKRVIINLLDNAIRRTPIEGVVQGCVEFFPESRRLRISVKDSGEGLAPEYHEKVFHKFEQMKLKEEGVWLDSAGWAWHSAKWPSRPTVGKSEWRAKAVSWAALLFLRFLFSTGDP